jgi:hypothetical protein
LARVAGRALGLLRLIDKLGLAVDQLSAPASALRISSRLGKQEGSRYWRKMLVIFLPLASSSISLSR